MEIAPRSYAAMRIDHLVWYNSNLMDGRRYFAERLDEAPLYGGEHPGEGTANAVVALGPSTYLEILGRDVHQTTAALDPEVASLKGQGLYHWAVGGIDLEDMATCATKVGLESGALVPGGRVRPDGKRLDWVCWGLRNHGFGSLIPFFIDWRDSEHPARSAPLGGSLEALEVRTPDVDRLRSIFHALDLDIPITKSAVPQLVATLKSSKGRTELTSFSPVPRGYVI